MHALTASERHRPDEAAEHDPIGYMILAGAPRPGEAPATNQPAIDMDRTGPAKGDRAAGRGMCREGITKGVQSDVKGAAGQTERFLGLQYHGKFEHVEATDIDERPGSLCAGDALGLDERFPHLPELDQPK